MSQLIQLDAIDCIIFDLGNVIINLDIEATDRAFKAIFQEDFDRIWIELKEDSFFDKYETGKITTEEFVTTLVNYSNGKANSTQIKAAWNAMLLDIPASRFNFLLQAKAQYKTLCLSNTNELHIDFINNYLKQDYQLDNLEQHFHQVFLSHEMGMRKPNEEIFEAVIQQHRLNPERTIFIDDTIGHLEGAQKTGLHTFHLKPEWEIEDYLVLN